MSAKTKKSKQGWIRKAASAAGRHWLPLVFMSVVVLALLGVHSAQGKNDAISHPPQPSTIPPTVVQIHPKNVTYELYGSLGGGGKVVYANLDSRPVEARLSTLPWKHSETTMASGATLSLVAQIDGDALGCRIIVNGEVLDEQHVNHDHAAVSCTVRAA